VPYLRWEMMGHVWGSFGAQCEASLSELESLRASPGRRGARRRRLPLCRREAIDIVFHPRGPQLLHDQVACNGGGIGCVGVVKPSGRVSRMYGDGVAEN